MRIIEVCSSVRTYAAYVRVIVNCACTVVLTTITAKTPQQAKAILARLYGEGNVISVTETLAEQGPKVLSADELRVKAMSDQAKRLQQQAKQIKAQNAVKKAQTNLTKAISQKQ